MITAGLILLAVAVLLLVHFRPRPPRRPDHSFTCHHWAGQCETQCDHCRRESESAWRR